MGIPASLPAPERRERPHDHAASSIYRLLAYPAVLPEPVLEFDHTSVDRISRAGGLAPNDSALREEFNKTPRSVHVLG
jgi:hypothetical protein